MDYLHIVLQGYYNDNTREYLSKYFIREFKKAEKEHYEADEFFNGCLKAVHTVEKDLSQQMYEDKKGLYIAIDEAKKRILGFDDNEGMEYDQLCERTISECKLKLKEITINDYSVNLYYLTKGKFIRHIFGDEVLYIKMAILEAQKNNMPQQLQQKENTTKNDILPPLPECFIDAKFWNALLLDPRLKDQYEKVDNEKFKWIGKKNLLSGLAFKLLNKHKLIDSINSGQQLAKIFCSYFGVKFDLKDDRTFRPERALIDRFDWIN